MSTTVDERVVEMRFDNAQFEKATSTTMSTLEKLKQKLNLTGASKGLENVGNAAKNINMSGLSGAIETVHAKFSALEVMGVTALANITNSAVNAGKRMVSALTTDPIKTGFSEYETQINAVQTILANTQSKGSTLTDVNKALDELNTYADKTIYNFTEMTRNIGTFTAAGVDLDKSVTAIKGIANLAAVSGSTSQQASTAMYQLSQALASGTVKLQDWNSVVNAGMGGEVFQTALKRTGKQMGYNVDAMIEKYGSFRESLTQGEWLTAEVLTETLTQISGAYSEADLIAQGYTKEQAKEIAALADTAVGAATEVKTFTQLWDTLKESAQSGWTQTWELIIGDFEEAKSLLTGLSDFLGGFINGISEARNKLLEGALASPFGKLAEKIQTVTGATEKMNEATKDYKDIVDKVINGEFGTGQARWDKLAEAGYDWAKVQNMVNEQLGSSTRHTEQLTEAQKENNKTQTTTIDQLIKMSDAQLKQLGFTKDEIEAFRELEEQSKKTGIPIKDLIKDTDQLSGRSLLINSFKNAGKGLVSVITAIRDAWRDAFPPMTSDQLYNIIAGLHKFSTYLVVSEDTSNKLTRTLKGAFAVLGIVSDIVGGGFKIAFKAVSSILRYFDMDILDVTANIGDALVAFRKATDISKLFDAAIGKIAPVLKTVATRVRELVTAFKELPQVQKIVTKFKEALVQMKDMDLKEIGKFILDGLMNGLGDGAQEAINKIIDLGEKLLEGIKGVLGIHSPSTEFFEIGRNIIQGLVNGIQNGASAVWETIKGVGSKCLEVLKGIDFGKVLAAGIGIGMLVTVKKLTDTLEKFAAPFEGLGNVLESFSGMLDSIGSGIEKNLKAKALEHKSKALLNMAIAVGILTASVALLCQLPTGKLWASIGALAALAAIIVALSFAASKMGSIDFRNFNKQSLFLVAMAGSLLILAIAMKKIASINADDIPKVLKVFTGMIIGMVALMTTFGIFASGGRSANIDKAGIMLLKMSVALLIMTKVISQASKLEDGAIKKGIGVIAALELLFAGIIGISKLAGKNANKAGGMLLMMSVALLMMIGVIKLASKLSGSEIGRGIVAVGAIGILFAGIIAVSKFAGQHALKAGGMLLLMSGALLIMTQVIKQISKLKDDEIKRGLTVVATIEVLFAAIIAVSKFAGENAVKAGVMLLLMSGALLVLTGVLFILSEMDPGKLKGALGIVTVLELLFAGLIGVTHFAQDCKGSLIVLTVAIGVLTAAVIGLSFLDPKKLAGATASLTILVGVFALLVASTKYINASGRMIAGLILMVGVVAILTGVVIALAQIKPDAALNSVISLSILMVAFAASMTLIGKAGNISTTAIGAMMAMLVVVAGLAAILGVLGYLDVQPSIQTVAALSLMLGAMSVALLVLSHVGPMAMTGVGALAVLGLVVAEIAVILGAMAYFDINPSIETAKSLSVLLIGMSAALVLLSVVGLMGPAALIGVGALAVLIAGIGTLIVAIGALMTEFPKLEEFLDRGIPVLEKIGYALGSFFGNMVGGFASGAAAGLPSIGTSLSQFMTNAEPFISGIKNVDSSAMEGVKALSGAILVLTAADLIAGVTSFLSGGSSFAQLGTSLSQFMTNAEPFISGIKGIDAEMGTGVKALAGAILTLTAADLIEGLTSWFTGGTSLTKFGEELAAFGPYMAEYAKSVAGIDGTTVEASATAAKSLAEMAKALPNSGGLAGLFAGENDMDDFGIALVSFGKSLTAYSHSVEGLNAQSVENSVTAAKSVTEIAENLPNSGGLAGLLAGNNDMNTFGSQLVSFGGALTRYSIAVTGLNTEPITASVTAAKSLTELAETIPNSGGFVGVFTGNNDMNTFGSQLVSFGGALTRYSQAVTGIESGAIVTSVYAARKLVEFINGLSELNTGGIGSFKNAVNSLAATNVNAFVNAFSGASSKLQTIGSNMINSIIVGITSKRPALTSAVTSVVTGMTKTVSGMNVNLNSIGATLIDNMTKGVISKKPLVISTMTRMMTELLREINTKKPMFMVAGIEIICQFINGMLSQSSRLSTIMSNPLNNAVTNARGYYNEFYNVGSYLVSGMVNGISANAYKVQAQASAMAKAAATAAEKELGIHSPSRVFYGIGDYAGQGFINALGDYASKTYKAGSNIADSARNGLSKAISQIESAMSEGIDTQPTIRPVIDLDDVKSGVGTINSMLNLGSTIGLSANVGSIGTITNDQNGNSDVIAAINKLRDGLSNVGGSTYIVDGITYDDGSNVSNAVKSLIRTAKIERRI